MPTNGMSETERFYNEMVSKEMATWFNKRPKPIVKPETCPYCGSANLTHHFVPLERTQQVVSCDDCSKEWDKA